MPRIPLYVRLVGWCAVGLWFVVAYFSQPPEFTR